jgi:2-iminoacetate synthase ThiH
MKEIPNSSIHQLTPEQINLIELNLELSVEEHMQQLQSAVDLIEEMRASLKDSNENRLQNSNK